MGDLAKSKKIQASLCGFIKKMLGRASGVLEDFTEEVQSEDGSSNVGWAEKRPCKDIVGVSETEDVAVRFCVRKICLFGLLDKVHRVLC